jgi:ABC-type multidrug transport system fused ATPase/permease subunit
VLLDEATASIDVLLEQKIQQAMEQELKDTTMITVAHILHTIIKSDKILVLQPSVCQENTDDSMKSNLLSSIAHRCS